LDVILEFKNFSFLVRARNLVASTPRSSSRKKFLLAPKSRRWHTAGPMHRRWSWFVLRAHKGQAVSAGFAVGKLGFQTYVPLVKSETGRRIVPLFDEYFFARWRDHWAPARYAKGVAEVITGAGQQLSFVHHAYVKSLQNLENHRGIIDFSEPLPPAPEFADGTLVRGATGAFINQLGKVTGSQDGEFVRVLFTIFGRDVPAVFSTRDLVAVDSVAA
jgi:transcription antitermination factor NusG